MKRARERKPAIVRYWIGRFLAVLLAFSPALNLFASPSAAAAQGDHHLSHLNLHEAATRHQQPSDCPGLDHFDLKCLQCLAMGGMSLAGVDLPPAPAPNNRSIGVTWSLAGLRPEPVPVRIPISRGPPSFA
jgi:hypothetical protein